MLASLCLPGCHPATDSAAHSMSAESTADISAAAAGNGIVISDLSFDHWEPTSFGAEGVCWLEDAVLTIESGEPLSGVTCTHSNLPRDDYEITLDARRVDGIDFFCGLTFPVKDSNATLIVGGWSGSVVGISCVDGRDANENETRLNQKFKRNQWYRIRLRVQNQRLAAWIDDQKIIDIDIAERELSLRTETLASRPLGICCFRTTAQYRNFTLKQLAGHTDEP